MFPHLRSKRFELPTFWFVAKRSIQLSYERLFLSSFLYYSKHRNFSSAILEIYVVVVQNDYYYYINLFCELFDQSDFELGSK